MRHLLVVSLEEELVSRLRAAAPASTTLLAERDLEAALERLARSARIDAVITDDRAVLAAIRAAIPGAIPVHVAAAGESARETFAAVDRLLV